MNTASQSFGVSFVLRNNTKNETNAIVFARVTVNGQVSEFSLKRRINSSNWNNLKGFAKGSKPEAISVNEFLNKVKIRLYECREKLLLKNDFISPLAIKCMFLNGSESGKLMSHLFTYHEQVASKLLTEGTRKHFVTTQKYFFDFLIEHKKVEDILINSVDYKFILDFEIFLRSKNGNNPLSPMCNNTVMKHLSRTRKLLNLAMKLNWLEKNPFTSFKLSYNPSKVTFISEPDLQLLERKQLGVDRLSFVRDIFVFSCYTGISFTDIVNLTPDNIILGIDGYKWLSFKRQKTSIQVKVPLFTKASELLGKYANHPIALHKGTCFPMFSNQKTNGYLKEIADLCGFNYNLTFHMARHTFATTIALSNGLPLETVSKLLGHSKITTTQIYAKVMEDKISKDVAELRTKIDKVNHNIDVLNFK